MSTKSRAWYVHFPQDPGALGPFRFYKPVTETEARAYIRQWESDFCNLSKPMQRLPNGTQVWKAER